MITDYHAKLYAHELRRRHSAGDSEKLAGALLDAQVDLNPHQVEAALFAFKSPLSKGAILADEVGLGKTIEAGLVLAQKWTEGKRRILVICPANLRKQWSQEMADKFFLPSQILESAEYNKQRKNGVRNPFEQPALVICSFQFAARQSADLMVTRWDLVVIDEAHRLRNVYRTDNKIGRALKGALANAPKVLLTATPLQNSLIGRFERMLWSVILAALAEQQAAWFDEEMDKLDGWAEDRRAGLKFELKEFDEQLKELKKWIRQTGNLPDKLALQRQARELEGRRDAAWRSYDEAAKQVEVEKDGLLDRVEAQLVQSVVTENLFTVTFQID